MKGGGDGFGGICSLPLVPKALSFASTDESNSETEMEFG